MISKNQIKLIRQLEQKKYRQREGLFVAEGPKVVGDLLRAGWQPQTVYATEEFSLTRSTPLDGAVNTEICVVTPDELRRISFLQHPQQVLALFSLPTSPTTPGLLPSATKRIQEGSEAGLLSIALDGVQDPGNLGTIIRIADWFGIETIYCSPDTVDAWSPKVVQATMGSVARVNIIYIPLEDLLRSTPLPVYGTLLDGRDIYQEPLAAEGIIVMGNEGRGISPGIRQWVKCPLLIPSFRQGETAESLNVAVATAITLSEFRRRHIRS